MVLLKKCTPSRRELMKHQQDYINWAFSQEKDMQHYACFMEMRLGKTLASIRLVQQTHHKEPKAKYPILVSAPSTVLETWERELTEEGEPYDIIKGDPIMRLLQGNVAVQSLGRNWALINNESVRATPDLGILDWEWVFIDESTSLKNPQTQFSRICCNNFRDVPHRCILSGLPSPESELDLFQQFKFLHGSFLMCDGYYEFRNEYFEISGYSGATYKPTPFHRQIIKEAVHRKAFVLRRADAGLKDQKFREVRGVDMHPDQELIYSQIEKEFAYMVQEAELNHTKETSHIIVRNMWMQRVAGGCDPDGNFKWDAKVKELCSLMKGELYGQAVVVWCRFTAEIVAVENALRRKGIAARALYGGSTAEEEDEAALDKRGIRANITKWFRESKDPTRVLVCQVKLAKYGIDLSAADTAIYYSLTHSCEENAQSEDRIYNPFKTSPLLMIYLVARKTRDEDIVQVVRQKVSDAKMFMKLLDEAFWKRIGQPEQLETRSADEDEEEIEE